MEHPHQAAEAWLMLVRRRNRNYQSGTEPSWQNLKGRDTPIPFRYPDHRSRGGSEGGLRDLKEFIHPFFPELLGGEARGEEREKARNKKRR